ncbi:unnamed protein product [Fraxinus pennsylvanica]|uniref:Uncharacterized protein n=1 Tax=Fraxinus pennsylvanica TaxID=56036 RepID=A0AAD2AA06_9LAMI|nr:unnamed protein product [Fraxinus pennsylvanica]
MVIMEVEEATVVIEATEEEEVEVGDTEEVVVDTKEIEGDAAAEAEVVEVAGKAIGDALIQGKFCGISWILCNQASFWREKCCSFWWWSLKGSIFRLALHCIRQIAQETNGKVYGLGRQPAVLRTISQRLIREFNDTINGFNDDGWSILNCDDAQHIAVAVNSSKNLSTNTNTVWLDVFSG